MLGHSHSHDHHHHDPDGRTVAAGRAGLRRFGRFSLASLVLVLLAATACLAILEPGQAVVVTRFGAPVRVATEPGLLLRWPRPIEAMVPVDLRLRTTSTGLHDVGTHDGLRILMQAYVAWRVPAAAAPIQQYLRAVRNSPDEAARQLRSYAGSSLEIVAARFDLAQLVNSDPTKVALAALEAALKERLQAQVLATYGIDVVQVGIERLTLPSEALEATVRRMSAERGTVAARRTAEGERVAAEIRSNADRDARIRVADARAEAARLEAAAALEAAGIYASAYRSDPALYLLLRSLDTLDTVVGDTTHLILRTDAAPFRVFIEASPVPAAPR